MQPKNDYICAYLKINHMKQIAIILIETLGFNALAKQMQSFEMEKCVEIAKQLVITECNNKMYLYHPLTRVKRLNPNHKKLSQLIELAEKL